MNEVTKTMLISMSEARKRTSLVNPGRKEAIRSKMKCSNIFKVNEYVLMVHICKLQH